MCPPFAVVDVPPDVAGAAVHPRTRSRPPQTAVPGPAFGSRRIADAVEIKVDAARLAAVDPAEGARLAVFQTWVRGIDVSALVDGRGRLRSIDHGYFLGGHRWDLDRLARSGPVRLKLPSQWAFPEHLADPALFAPALHDLSAIREEAVVAAFAGLPREWGVPLPVRARVAAWVLERRQGVPAAVRRGTARLRAGRRDPAAARPRGGKRPPGRGRRYGPRRPRNAPPPAQGPYRDRLPAHVGGQRPATVRGAGPAAAPLRAGPSGRRSPAGRRPRARPGPRPA